jgi:hypothetical protein
MGNNSRGNKYLTMAVTLCGYGVRCRTLDISLLNVILIKSLVVWNETLEGYHQFVYIKGQLVSELHLRQYPIGE